MFVTRLITSLIDRPARSSEYFLGVDGGGTKTHAVVIDYSCRVLGSGLSGPSNPARVKLEEAVSHIGKAIETACAEARIKPRRITAGCAAVAGTSDNIHYNKLKDALIHKLRLNKLELVTDASAALQGALDGQPGVVVIAGTGSIAMGVNDARERARSGGWGSILGDEGSAYDIALSALKAVMSWFDGRSSGTMLAVRICNRLGVAGPGDLPGVIYKSSSEPVDIALLAELVDEAAQEGDETARRILTAAGQELGRLAVSVIEKLDLRSQAFRVACVGSVFRSGEFVVKPFREAVLSVAPHSQIGPPIYPPAIGAAKLAIGTGAKSNTDLTRASRRL